MVTLLFYYQQYLFFLFMNFQNTGAHPNQNTPLRKVDVILLRDNRESSTQEKPFSDYRCSAFKETEVDPLEDRGREGQLGDSIEQLNKRVTRLQDKVEELISLQSGMLQDVRGKTKKKRRRFDEMEREYKCRLCPRYYGSETALKCHFKLKHPDAKEQV